MNSQTPNTEQNIPELIDEFGDSVFLKRQRTPLLLAHREPERAL